MNPSQVVLKWFNCWSGEEVGSWRGVRWPGFGSCALLSASVPAQVQRIQSHLLFGCLRFSERQMVSLELLGMTGIFNELVTKNTDALPAG